MELSALPGRAKGKKGRSLKKVDPGGVGEGSCQSAERRRLRERVSAGAGEALALKGELREDFTDGCGDSVVTKLPPPSRPRAPVTHMRGPRPLGLLPPRGQQAAGRGG